MTLAIAGLGCPGGVTKTKYPYIYITRCLLVGIKINASAAAKFWVRFLSASLYFPYIVFKHSPKVAMDEAFNGGLRSFKLTPVIPT